MYKSLCYTTTSCSFPISLKTRFAPQTAVTITHIFKKGQPMIKPQDLTFNLVTARESLQVQAGIIPMSEAKRIALRRSILLKELSAEEAYKAQRETLKCTYPASLTSTEEKDLANAIKTAID